MEKKMNFETTILPVHIQILLEVHSAGRDSYNSQYKWYSYEQGFVSSRILVEGHSAGRGSNFEALCYEAGLMVSVGCCLFWGCFHRVSLVFLFGPFLAGFVFETLCHEVGFLISFACWLFWVCFVSVLPLFLFGPFLFEEFVFGTLCHEVWFLVSFGCCLFRFFWYCFAYVLVWSFSTRGVCFWDSLPRSRFLGFFGLLVVFWVVSVSVSLLSLFDPFLYEDFVFETLCHEVGFLASVVCWLFFGLFLVVFRFYLCLILFYMRILFLRLSAMKSGSWFLSLLAVFIICVSRVFFLWVGLALGPNLSSVFLVCVAIGACKFILFVSLCCIFLALSCRFCGLGAGTNYLICVTFRFFLHFCVALLHFCGLRAGRIYLICVTFLYFFALFCHFVRLCVTCLHFCVTSVILQMSRFILFVSFFALCRAFVSPFAFSCTSILLVMNSEGTSVLILSVPKKCANNPKTDF